MSANNTDLIMAMEAKKKKRFAKFFALKVLNKEQG